MNKVNTFHGTQKLKQQNNDIFFNKLISSIYKTNNMILSDSQSPKNVQIIPFYRLLVPKFNNNTYKSFYKLRICCLI